MFHYYMASQHTTSALSDRLSEFIDDCAVSSHRHLTASHEAVLRESAIATLPTGHRIEPQTIETTDKQFNP